MTNSPLIKTDHIYLEAGTAQNKVKILQDVGFSIDAGESIGIVGPSGSGKTSLMMVMAGLMRATSGEIYFKGEPLGGLDEDALARYRHENIGIVFQNFHLIPTLTAFQNVAFPLDLVGRRDAQERAEYWLNQVGLGHRMHHMPTQLSGGEQQRAALARALITEPALLLADEPTGNLDTENGEKITHLMFDMARDHGTALVMITHDEALAARTSRRIKLVDGRVVEDVTRSGASGAARIAAASSDAPFKTS